MKISQEPDRGAAMIFVLMWSVVLVGVVLAVTQVAIRQIVPSDQSERTFAALSAAEAGLADYLVRLETTGYENSVDPSNPAFFGFVDVPGGSSGNQFTYAIDSSKAASIGEIRVYSTGRSGDQQRTIEAVLSKRSTLDYTYLSDIETPSPDVPGAYSTASGSGGNSSTTGRELANRLCNRYWYESGDVDPQGRSGNQRNLNFCQWAGIYASESIKGRIHTNDVWRLEATNLTGSIDAGAMSSSCRSEEEGLAPGEVGCPAGHRYLTTTEPLNSNSILDARWSGSTSYQGDSFGPSSNSDPTGRNPRYEPVLELPSTSGTAAELKKRASEGGCVFTGPTRLRFEEVGGQGVVRVTSPDSRATGDNCGGRLEDSSAPHITGTITLSNFEDLVIYVQNLPSAGVDDPNNDYDLNNVWPSGSEPTCQRKVGSPSPSNNFYPFVVPSDSGESSKFNSTSAPKGFPSYYADVNSPWYGSSCTKGDIYLEGELNGRVTVAAENNVILTSSMRDSTASLVRGDNYGKPAENSESVMGIVAGEFAYIYRPTDSSNDWVGDWKEENAQDPIFNAAILAVDSCFGSQDATYGSRNGFIYLWGSLSQKYRCVVGYVGGYSKSYKYDERLASLSPPFMVALFGEPWETRRFGEINVTKASVGTSTFDLVEGEPVGASVSNVQIVFGNATVSTVGSTITLSAPTSGSQIVRYTVENGSNTQTRRLVVSVQ